MRAPRGVPRAGTWGRRLPAIAGSTSGSVATALTGQALLVASGILATRLLGPDNRGHLALLAVLPSVISQLGLLGVPDAVTYGIARDRRAAAGIVRSMAAPIAAQLFLCSLLHAFGVWMLVRDESQPVQVAGLATLAVTPAFLANSYGLAVVKGLQCFGAMNALRLVPLVLYGGALVPIFLVEENRLPAVAVAWAAANLCAAVAAIAVVTRLMPRGQHGDFVPARADLFRFGAKGFLGSVSPLETFRLDQAVVGLFLSPAALGLYVASLAFTNLPRFVAGSVGMVAFPYIASQPDSRLARRSMWRFFWITVGGSLAVAVVLIVSARELLPLLFGSDFRGAVAPAQILLVGSVIFGARRILGEGMRGLGHPTANTVAEIASWLWLLPALAVLTPRWELEGVAVALVSASVFSLGVLAVTMFGVRERVPAASAGRATDDWTRGVRPRFRPSGRSVFTLAVIILGGVVGWAVTVVPVGLALLAGGVLGFALGIPLVRWVLSRLHEHRPPTIEPTATTNVTHPILTIPRYLYYCGAATVAILVIRPTPALTISDWFFLMSLLLTILTLLLTKRLSITGLPGLLLTGTIVFSVGALISSLNAPSPMASVLLLARFVYLIFAWFWLSTVVLETPAHVRIATACWTASAALSGAAALAQLLLGDVIPNTQPIFGRMTGLTQHFNDLGASVAIALVPAIMISSVMPGRLRRLLGLAVILPLVVAGLLLSGSVGGLVAGGVSVLFWVGMGRLSAKMIVGSLVVGLGVLLVLSLQRNAGSPSPIERFRETTDAANPYCTLCSRLDTTTAAWDVITQHPLLGAGLGSSTETGEQVHNLVIGLWFEAGILGAVGITTIVLAVGLTALRAIRAARSREEWLIALALFASYLSFIVISMGQPILFQRYGWICAALILAIRRQQVTQTVDIKPKLKRAAWPTLVSRVASHPGVRGGRLGQPGTIPTR